MSRPGTIIHDSSIVPFAVVPKRIGQHTCQVPSHGLATVGTRVGVQSPLHGFRKIALHGA